VRFVEEGDFFGERAYEIGLARAEHDFLVEELQGCFAL
jgi:hypothetical protein